MLRLGGLNTIRISKVKGHADEDMVHDGWVGEVDRLGNNATARLLTLVVGELVMLSLMLVVICLGFVVSGTLLFLIFIGSSLPYLVLWSIMTDLLVLLLPMVWSAGSLA